MAFNIKSLWWVFALVAAVLLYILWMIPAPTATGSCGMSCTVDTVLVPYESGTDIDLSGVCPSTCDCCEITSVSWSITQDGWDVDYKCCNCQGSTQLALQKCSDLGFLGPVYRFLGWCK
jgi:hypothetical protein